MINGDSSVWLDATIKHDLLITDGTVTISGSNYTVSGGTVTIDNDILDTNAFTLRQAISTGNQIRFGSCGTAAINFTIHENIPTLKDKVLTVYFLPEGDGSKMVQIGVFKIYEDKLLADRIRRNIVGYDAMYEVLNADAADWYNTILPSASSAVTLAQFRASFLNYFGIVAESVTLINDTITIKRTIDPETLSGADIIKAICEINGVFGVINNEGLFRFVELSAGIDDGLFPSDTLYPANDLYPQDTNPHVTPMPKAYYTNVKFEDWISEKITGLTIRTDNKDVGVTVGTSTNKYIISGNFLVFGYNSIDLTSVATNVLDKIKNRYYKPCVIEAVGNPLHEVGDPIRISTTYRGVVTYILERKLNGIQSLRDTYTARGEKYFNEQLNNTGTQYKQLASKTTKIEKDVDGVRVYVDEQLDDTVQGSYAYVTAEEIGAKVSKETILTDLNSKLDSSSVQIASNRITCESTGSLVVNTANFKLDASGNAEFNGLIKGAQLESGSIIIARNPGGGHASIMSSGGFAAGESTSTGIDTNNAIDIDGASKAIKIRESGVGSLTLESNSILVYNGNDYTSISVSGISAPSIQANSSLTVYGSVTIVGSSATINNHAILTDDSTINVNKLTGQINSNTNITFGKYLNAVGTSADYELKLQTITINGTRYVMYAEEQP